MANKQAARRMAHPTFRRIVPNTVHVRQLRYLFHGLFVVKFLVTQLNRFRRTPLAQHTLPSSRLSQIVAQGILTEYQLCRWLPIPFGSSLLAILENRKRTA